MGAFKIEKSVKIHTHINKCLTVKHKENVVESFIKLCQIWNFKVTIESILISWVITCNIRRNHALDNLDTKNHTVYITCYVYLYTVMSYSNKFEGICYDLLKNSFKPYFQLTIFYPISRIYLFLKAKNITIYNLTYLKLILKSKTL